MVQHARGRHRSERDSWNSLRLFQIYRLGFTLVLLCLHFFYTDSSNLGSRSAGIFVSVCLLATMTNVALIYFAFSQRICFRHQVFATLSVDVVSLTILIFASGGLSSGLGLILITSVTGCSLLLPGRKAPFFAAVATLCLFCEEIFSWLYGYQSHADYDLVAIHGAVLFTIALLAAHLARRAQSSEALASQRAEDLASLSALNEHIVDRLQSGVLVMGFDQRVRLMNQAALRLLDCPPLNHRTDLQALSPALLNLWREWAAQPAPRRYPLENPANGKDLDCRFIRIGSGTQLATLVFVEDVSEQRRQMQDIKLASLGRLTASIAHEIRNPLGSISHAAQLLAESNNLDSGDSRLVEIVNKNARRMNVLIEDVLSLSRRPSPQRVEVELAQWLRGMVNEYLQQQSPGLDIQLELCEQQVKVDTNHLHQVVWNLLTNARRYAKPINEQLKLVIKLAQSPDRAFTQIDIIDNGEPLAESTQRHLFEPFFTTSTEGTGLGLFISRELCQSNGGALHFMPAVQGGNCFRVQLPVTT